MESGTVRLRGPLADPDAWSRERCSMARALEVVGTRSALLLMREAFYGTTRFDAFARRAGITEAVAAARLRDLVGAGLLEKRPYREAGQRTRQEYVLTASGRDLTPAVLGLMQWGDKHAQGEAGAPLALRHDGDCGAPVRVEIRCAEGHEVGLEDVVVEIARPRLVELDDADRAGESRRTRERGPDPPASPG